MTLQSITCFLNLAETLNYTKTAQELFISQPAVTRHINSLEEELGIKLFDRSVRRNITLTEAGKIYYKGLKKCKNIYEDTVAAINLKATESPLIINFLRGIRTPDAIVDATGNYMVKHPNFHHYPNFIDTSEFEKSIENGEIVICQEEFAESLSNYQHLTLTYTPVPHYIVANHKHFAFATDPVDMQKIKDTTLFLPKNLPNVLKDKYISNLKELLGTTPVEIMYLDSMDSVEQFLRSGRCFTIASEWNSVMDSSHNVAYKLGFSSNYIAIWDNTKCLNPFAEDYLNYIHKALE